MSSILWPLISLMRILLVAFHGAIGSYGAAIMLLSLVVRVITAPISRFAAKADARDQKVQAAMQGALEDINRTSKGRERFERTEALYKQYNYHPIKSVASLLPLFLQIPFLLAALFLLSDFAPLRGQRFLVIPDLLEPDGLISLGDHAVNLLPLLITAVALVESLIGGRTKAAKRRFLIVSLVIVVLIYPAPASVCIYWLTSNLLSLLKTAVTRRSTDASLATE